MRLYRDPDPDIWQRYRTLVRSVLASCILIIVSAFSPLSVSAASDGIGKAEKVVLDVRSLLPRGERRLVVNADVFKDEIVETKDRSATRLVFRDETYLSMGPNSKVRIADLPVAQDADRPFVVEATSGVFKFVSGQLRSDQYRIETPSATIGVRGTILWLSVSGTGLTQVASQTGEVIVCGQRDCVTLLAGEYSKVEPDRSPTPPGTIPEDFYALVRDMTARLMMDGIDGITAALDASAFAGLYNVPAPDRGVGSRLGTKAGLGASGGARGGFGRGRPSVASARETTPTSETGDTEPETSENEQEQQPDADDNNDGAETGEGAPGSQDGGAIQDNTDAPEDPEDPVEPGTGVWPDTPEATPGPVAIPVPATALFLLFAFGVLIFVGHRRASVGTSTLMGETPRSVASQSRLHAE